MHQYFRLELEPGHSFCFMFHLFGLTDSPSARQPGNDAPVGPNNGAINATKLQEKCKFKSDKIVNINCERKRNSLKANRFGFKTLLGVL